MKQGFFNIKIICIVMLSFLGFKGFGQSGYAYLVKVGDMAPDFETTTPDG